MNKLLVGLFISMLTLSGMAMAQNSGAGLGAGPNTGPEQSDATANDSETTGSQNTTSSTRQMYKTKSIDKQNHGVPTDGATKSGNSGDSTVGTSKASSSTNSSMGGMSRNGGANPTSSSSDSGTR